MKAAFTGLSLLRLSPRRLVISIRYFGWLYVRFYNSTSKIRPHSLSLRNSHYRACMALESLNRKSKSDSVSLIQKPLAAELTDGKRLPKPSAKVNKRSQNIILQELFSRPLLKQACSQHGITEELFIMAREKYEDNFTKIYSKSSELQDCLIHIKDGLGHVDDLFPHFLGYCQDLFPVLGAAAELKAFSDLRRPEKWYHMAREMKRKVIFHAGPTNSGKTYHALERFLEAETGVYCGPLRMLAAEIAVKTNDRSVPCDMLTGEEKIYVVDEEHPSSHTSCTVEMCKVDQKYDCAVIDEIQMMRDPVRGAAWTRAFLGVAAKELHLCGEVSAINLIERLTAAADDELEVRHYERLTPLTLATDCLGSLSHVEKGDCVIAFSQKELFRIRRCIEEETGLKCAIIYGGLPPAVRMQQAKCFNDPNDDHRVLVASDAVGMGINLNIRRIVFSRIEKFDGKNVSQLAAYHAKQISGRAGRFGTTYEEGHVTALDQDDLKLLTELVNGKHTDVKQAGILPTFEHLEMMFYQLPNVTLLDLLGVFEVFKSIDDDFFLCQLNDIKRIANAIKDIPLNLWQRYTFCQAPADKMNNAFVLAALVKFARLVSNGRFITCTHVLDIFDWPLRQPCSLQELQLLEACHKITDVYLWLSHRFEEFFVDSTEINEIQDELERLIHDAVMSDFEWKHKQEKGRGEQNRSKHGINAMFSVVDKSVAKRYGHAAAEMMSSGRLSAQEIALLYSEWGQRPRHKRHPKHRHK